MFTTLHDTFTCMSKLQKIDQDNDPLRLNALALVEVWRVRVGTTSGKSPVWSQWRSAETCISNWKSGRRRPSRALLERLCSLAGEISIALSASDFNLPPNDFLSKIEQAKGKSTTPLGPATLPSALSPNAILGRFKRRYLAFFVGRFQRDDKYKAKVRIGFFEGQAITEAGQLEVRYLDYDVNNKRIWLKGTAQLRPSVLNHEMVTMTVEDTEARVPPNFMYFLVENNEVDYHSGIGIIFNRPKWLPSATRVLLVYFPWKDEHLCADRTIPVEWPEEHALLDLLANYIPSLDSEVDDEHVDPPRPSRLYPVGPGHFESTYHTVIEPIMARISEDTDFFTRPLSQRKAAPKSS